MSHSFIGLCEILAAAQPIHTFLKLGIGVKRKDVMLLLFLRSVGHVICGSLDSYRCSVALLMRDGCLIFVTSAYICIASDNACDGCILTQKS